MEAGSRRQFLRQAGGIAAGAALYTQLGHGGVWAAGSDAPEKKEVKIGFIPLTDCASVVMASVLGFDQKYGVKIIPTRKPAGPACATSWSTASWTSPMCSTAWSTAAPGRGGPKKDMAVLMT
jgi:nitrate/nitrite transport system substrate-binding protein